MLLTSYYKHKYYYSMKHCVNQRPTNLKIYNKKKLNNQSPISGQGSIRHISIYMPFILQHQVKVRQATHEDGGAHVVQLDL